MIDAASTPEIALPAVGYSVAEVERILNIPTKTGYRLIKQGRLKAFVTSDGVLKVHPYELWRYITEEKDETCRQNNEQH